MENIILSILLLIPSLVVLVFAGSMSFWYIKDKDYLLATISFVIALCVLPIMILATCALIHSLQ